MASLDLNARVTQSGFADLVGCSQQAIAEKVANGTLPRDSTYAEWLFLYCDRLRKEAAGRSGEAQDQLTRARIEESRENTAEKRQRRLVNCGTLVHVGDIQQIVLDLAATMRNQFLLVGEKVHEEIQAKYSITLEDSDVQEPIRAGLRLVSDRAQQLRESLGADAGGADTQADSINSGMGAAKL